MIFRNSIAWLFMIGLAASGLHAQAPKKPEEAPKFQWLDASDVTTGIQYSTHQLKSLSGKVESGPPVEIEREEKQLDAQTTRITSSTFSSSVNGERRLEETIVEEIKKLPDGKIQAVRTTSKRNVNGGFSPVQKETQEVARAGTDSYRITKTLLMPGIDGKLVEKEQVRQVEKKKGNAFVEIDRIRYQPDLSGAWSVLDRRVSQNQLAEDRTRTDEQVYKYDVNNRLVLTQQIQVDEWKDSVGQTHLQSESFAAGINGKMQLSSRTTMLQKPLKNGNQETTEIQEEPNAVAPSEGLRVARKIVEKVTIANPRETERQLEVLAPDLNGGMSKLYTQKTTESR